MEKCTICSHGAREEIDRALVRGEGLRGVAFAISVAGKEVGRNMESPCSTEAFAGSSKATRRQGRPLQNAIPIVDSVLSGTMILRVLVTPECLCYSQTL
jgi:hypothetical protein